MSGWVREGDVRPVSERTRESRMKGYPRSWAWYETVVKPCWVDGYGWASQPRLAQMEEAITLRRAYELGESTTLDVIPTTLSDVRKGLGGYTDEDKTTLVPGMTLGCEQRPMTLARARQGAHPMRCPQIVHGILHTGVGRAAEDGPEMLVPALGALTQVTGQKARTHAARHSVASFHLRRGMPISAQVTLRGDAFYAFWDALLEQVLSSGREFRGFPVTLAATPGQVTIGLPDGLSHPSLQPWVDHLGLPVLKSKKGPKSLRPRLGWAFTIATTAPTAEATLWLLSALQLPFLPGQLALKGGHRG